MIEELSDPATTARLARSEEWYDVPGYASFGEAVKDVEELVGVTWVSGTRMLMTFFHHEERQSFD